MFKTLRDVLIGAFVAGAVTAALGAIGTIPSNGFALPDGQWLNGLSQGHNSTFQSGFTAAGTTQATATQLPDLVKYMEVDTTASSTGVALPPAIAGMQISVYNNGVSTLAIYPAIAPTTQDTINNGTSLSGGLASHAIEVFTCAKTGVWAAK